MDSMWIGGGMKDWEKIWCKGKKHGMETHWYKSGEKQKEIYYIHDEEYAGIEWDEKKIIIKVNFPNPAVNTTDKSKESYRKPTKIGLT